MSNISHRLRPVGFVHIEGSDAYDPAGGVAAIEAGDIIRSSKTE